MRNLQMVKVHNNKGSSHPQSQSQSRFQLCDFVTSRYVTKSQISMIYVYCLVWQEGIILAIILLCCF